MATIITASYDLCVPVRERVRLDVRSLTTALAELKLEVEIPSTARLHTTGLEYIPARVRLPKAVIRTGFTLSSPETWPRGGVGAEEAMIDGELANFSLFAFNAPAPRDENELPLSWFVAAAIAQLGRGAVFDPQADDEPLEGGRLTARLRKQRRAFDPTANGWDEYPYELFVALYEGDEARARTEIEPLKNVDTPDAHGNTPLMLALRAKLPGLAAELLTRGADQNAANRYGSTPLDDALKAHDAPSLRLLLDRGADGDVAALRMAASGTQDALERLLDAGVSIDAATPGGWTLLMMALYDGHVEVASWLIERGARLDAVNRDGATPLMIAADHGHDAIVGQLLERGADPGYSAPNGATALAWAKRGNHHQVVKLLSDALPA